MLPVSTHGSCSFSFERVVSSFFSLLTATLADFMLWKFLRGFTCTIFFIIFVHFSCKLTGFMIFLYHTFFPVLFPASSAVRTLQLSSVVGQKSPNQKNSPFLCCFFRLHPIHASLARVHLAADIIVGGAVLSPSMIAVSITSRVFRLLRFPFSLSLCIMISAAALAISSRL